MKYNDLMIDIETMGQRPGCAIFNVAAIPFNLEGGICDNVFFSTINLRSQLSRGLKSELRTINWWIDNSPEKFLCYLKESLIKESPDIDEVFLDMTKFITENLVDKFKPWSRGSKFDLPIIEYAADACGFNMLLPQMNERCVRTYVSIKPDLQVLTKEVHNPIEDCMAQIKSVQNVYTWLRNQSE